MANDDKIVSDEFSELFHYTNVSAFENIYNTRKLWATHYLDLNDTSEFSRFRLKVQQFIFPKIRDIFDRQMHLSTDFATDVNSHGGIDAVVGEEVEDVLSVVHNRTFGKEMYKETFVISFCAHTQPDEAKDGLLSQWRGYSEGGGVAIVFDTSKLEKMLRLEHDKYQINNISTLSTVIYDHPSSGPIIKDKFKSVFTNFPDILKERYPESGPPDLPTLQNCFEAMHDDLLFGSIRVKHNAFHEKNEIRLVVPITTIDSFSYDSDDSRPLKKIRYKQKGNCEVQYIELFGHMPLPIKRVIVGPSRIQNLNFQKINELTDPSIEVVKSDIPFVG